MSREMQPIPKIIKLGKSKDPAKDHLVESIEVLLDLAKRGILENFILAGFDKYDQVITSNPLVNIVEEQYLIAILQTRCTFKSIENMLEETHYAVDLYEQLEKEEQEQKDSDEDDKDK